MSVETTPQENRPTGVKPAAPWRLQALTVLPDYRLALTFQDGKRGIVDLSAIKTARNAGIFGALADPTLFIQAHLEIGAITWPNGADLDPAWLHEQVGEEETWAVPFN